MFFAFKIYFCDFFIHQASINTLTKSIVKLGNTPSILYKITILNFLFGFSIILFLMFS